MLMLARINDLFDELSSVNYRSSNLHNMVSQYTRKPLMDIYEDNKTIWIKADLPGFSSEDIKVNVEKDVLILECERKLENKENKNDYLLQERSHGIFKRSFVLPDYVATDEITAEHKDGVLTVMLPKTRESETRNIQVKIG